MRIEVISLFPTLVEQVGQYGMPRRAVECGALQLLATDLRDFAERADRRVDARSFGGGPGMVLQPEPVRRALVAARARAPQAKVVALSPQGERLGQAWVARLAQKPGLVVLCGRYEGWDERLAPLVDVELSIGDFVLSGGELAAMSLVDAIARLLPGVLGNACSAGEDSFSHGHLDYPHYTRPRVWRGAEVPEVLLSGDHAAIRRWRLKRALGATWLKHPELLAGLELDQEQAALLRDFIAEGQGPENEV
ncbi:MAG TPA: tRNA (guanosine(37)-N1)-methyltransferase TrmD [Nevskiaceae bacterium]|nr:tRNA (guanosine(37)-N1)-methyltransferase TrmD [Nevskiaceae bacterium]